MDKGSVYSHRSLSGEQKAILPLETAASASKVEVFVCIKLHCRLFISEAALVSFRITSPALSAGSSTPDCAESESDETTHRMNKKVFLILMPQFNKFANIHKI